MTDLNLNFTKKTCESVIKNRKDLHLYGILHNIFLLCNSCSIILAFSIHFRLEQGRDVSLVNNKQKTERILFQN